MPIEQPFGRNKLSMAGKNLVRDLKINTIFDEM